MDDLRAYYDALAWHEYWPDDGHVNVAGYVDRLGGCLFCLLGHEEDRLDRVVVVGAAVHVQITDFSPFYNKTWEFDFKD